MFTSKPQFDLLSRRTFLKLPALTGSVTRSGGYRSHHDHVMGTSLDLFVFTSSKQEAIAAEAVVLREIARLSRILSTWDPASEISRLGPSAHRVSPELAAIFRAYEHWNSRTGGAIASRIRGALNIDALAKPFIATKAVEAASRAVPGMRGIMLDAGGDVVVSGAEEMPVAVSDPLTPWYNASPLSVLKVSGGAIVTSGITARGAHIIDPRSGLPATSVLSATVIADDSITANACSTAICVLGPVEGLRLIERTPGVECLIVSAAGRQFRSTGFSRFERPVLIPAATAADWPAGFDISIDLTLKNVAGRRPFVAVWVEDMQGQLIRNIVIFAGQPRYLDELHEWWNINADNPLWYTSSRPTPAPGRYPLRWDGLDERRKSVPQGTYKVFVETSREHSYYEKESTQIVCGDTSSAATVKATPEFDAVPVIYGPRKQIA